MSVPDVAVTEKPALNVWKPPLQAVVFESRIPTASIPSSERNFLRFRNNPPIKQRARNSPPETAPFCAVVLFDAFDAAETVSMLSRGAPAGVRDEGEKEQVTPSGSPVQASVTGELNPLSGLMTIVAAVAESCRVSRLELGIEREKSVFVRLNSAVVEDPVTDPTTA